MNNDQLVNEFMKRIIRYGNVCLFDKSNGFDTQKTDLIISMIIKPLSELDCLSIGLHTLKENKYYYDFLSIDGAKYLTDPHPYPEIEIGELTYENLVIKFSLNYLISERKKESIKKIRNISTPEYLPEFNCFYMREETKMVPHEMTTIWIKNLYEKFMNSDDVFNPSKKTIKNKNFPWFCYEFIDKKNSFFYHFMMTSQAAIVLFKLENTDMEEELKSKLRWKILMDSTTIIPSNYSIFS